MWQNIAVFKSEFFEQNEPPKKSNAAVKSLKEESYVVCEVAT